jgi:hypothetical protein
MPRFETSSQRDTGEKNKPNLFQRLWKNTWPEAQKSVEREGLKPIKKLKEIFKHASTPREKELVQEDGEVQKETRGLLSRLRENVEPSKRKQIKELRETVVANPDISKDKEAVRAYQELIKITDPERFAREIGKVDGIYGPKTKKAYEVDKQTLDEPRPAILTALSSNTPKETPQARIERTNGSGWLKNLFNFHNIGGGGALGAGKYQSIKPIIDYDSDGSVRMTMCSKTARYNMKQWGLDDVPQPMSAIDAFGMYKRWGYNISGLSTGWFNAPAWAKVADIVMSTGRAHGHRSMAYRQWKTWYVNDPFVGKWTNSIPLKQYEQDLRKRWWKIEGTAFYDDVTMPA